MNHALFHRIVLFALTAVGLFALVYLCLFAWVCYAESHLETPPETDVIPGHGVVTTIARELASNPFLKA